MAGVPRCGPPAPLGVLLLVSFLFTVQLSAAPATPPIQGVEWQPLAAQVERNNDVRVSMDAKHDCDIHPSHVKANRVVLGMPAWLGSVPNL